MKKLIISIASVALAISAGAQIPDLTTNTDKLQIVGAGLRGGLGSFMQDGTGLSTKFGVNGAVDGVYCFYFQRKDSDHPYIGIRSGLSVAYGQNKVTADDVVATFETEKDGIKISYKSPIKDIEETNRQLSIEVPIMASAIYKSFWANLGVRVAVPIITKYKQEIGDGSGIVANITDNENFDLDVENAYVLGRLESNSFDGDFNNAASVKILAAFEGGYAFDIAGQWLAVGLYFNYGVYSNYDGGNGGHVDANVDELPAKISLNSVTESYSDKMNDMSFGIKASYNWQLGKSSGKSSKSKSSKSSKKKGSSGSSSRLR